MRFSMLQQLKIAICDGVDSGRVTPCPPLWSFGSMLRVLSILQTFKWTSGIRSGWLVAHNSWMICEKVINDDI